MKIGIIGTGTGLAHAQISRQLSNQGHEVVFVDETPDFTRERLGTLEEVFNDQSEALVKEIFEIRALPRDNEFYNPSFQSNNRQARRKAEKEAKKRKKNENRK